MHRGRMRAVVWSTKCKKGLARRLRAVEHLEHHLKSPEQRGLVGKLREQSGMGFNCTRALSCSQCSLNQLGEQQDAWDARIAPC